MGRGTLNASRVNTNSRPYDSFDKTVVDTLIVERDGRYQIEQYAGQNLDEYDYAAEMNHDKLLTNKYQQDHGAWYMRDITLDDIYDYLKKKYNFKV